MVRRDRSGRINPSVDGADAAPAGSVPWPLVITAAYAWRFIAIGVLLAIGIAVFARLSPIVLPLMIAVLITAPLERLVTRMERRKIPRGLGAAIVLLSLVLTVVGLMTIAGTAIVAGFEELRQAAIKGVDQFIEWLITGPLHVAEDRLTDLTGQATAWLEENWAGVANGALSVTGTIGQVLAGMVIALIGLFFFLRDGRRMWLWFVNAIGGGNATRIDNAGRHSWITLRRYTQTSAFVAFVDAVGIGLAAWILGIPLAFPIAITVFLLAFIPLFGATISGAIAVAVALVDGGWVTALIMLGAVVLVQQIEGAILYPWLFGKAASIHPMIVLVSVSAGTLLAGFLGAVIAVPIVAFTIAFIKGLRKEFVVEEPESAWHRARNWRRASTPEADEADRLVGD